jgi:hypothetical protein
VSLAYLVLAHHQPALLARLVDQLLDRDAHVFVHVDRRADLRPFLEAFRGLSSPWRATNLHLAEERRKVAYFGFTTVEATLSLMRQATAFGRFSYHTLLSGADYPIKSREAIRDFFEGRDTEFLVYWLLDDRPSWKHKVEHYFLADYVPIRNLKRPTARNAWRLPRTFRYLYWRAFARYKDRFPRRRYPFADLRPYGGSQWWSLTDGCVRFVLDYVAEHPEVVRFYRYTQCPDELFFQTIVMNSSYAGRAANHAEYVAWSAQASAAVSSDRGMLPEDSFNLRYIDWSGGYRGERGYPAVLDDRDFERLRDSPCLFARKFEAVRSAGLLDRIDAEILDRSAVPAPPDPGTPEGPGASPRVVTDRP